MTTLTASIAGFDFDGILLNAAGINCQSIEELDQIRTAPGAASLVTKTATQYPRSGNEGIRYADMPIGSINSMGLPNYGLEYYIEYVEKYQHEKPIFLSTAGITHEEILYAMRRIEESDFNGLIELNFSCPNVPGKPQIGYDFATTEALLSEIFTFFTKRVGVKLPPYFDIAHFDQVAEILNKFPLAFVNSINSIGNGLTIDPETDTVTITPKGGFGGLGGAIAKPTALANVRAFRERLHPEIKVIGTGGVTNGRDVYDLILAGAEIVEIGTTLYQEGPAVFERLNAELIAEMERHGYDDLAQFRGKLKTLAADPTAKNI